jgi:hypothetical protein
MNVIKNLKINVLFSHKDIAMWAAIFFNNNNKNVVKKLTHSLIELE